MNMKNDLPRVIEPKYAHRSSRVALRFVGADGKPIVGKEARVRQTDIRFKLGARARELYIAFNPATREIRRATAIYLWEKIAELFNSAWLDAFDWIDHEKSQRTFIDQPLRDAVQWLTDRNLDVKGHSLYWNIKEPAWTRAIEPERVARLALDRAQRLVSDFAPHISDWTVIKSAVALTKPYGDSDPMVGRAESDKQNTLALAIRNGSLPDFQRGMFETAKAANPGAIFRVNDFDRNGAFEALLRRWLDEGFPLDAIGLECMPILYDKEYEAFLDALERYASLGLPMHVSLNVTPYHDDEFLFYETPIQGWRIPIEEHTPQGMEDRQARYAAKVYDALYACPRVYAAAEIQMVDVANKFKPPGIFHQDYSERAICDVIRERLNGAWRTEGAAVTNANGEIEFVGTAGSYEAELGGKRVSFEANGGGLAEAIEAKL
ncbi:MAG: endo-1,4-beta-xylanase [Oscillospiraceae bacterium]|jgi:hypothetical protein|nr:endo-1,4-beta-xylanase [Oscillospiraceae bacterium]